MTPGFNKGRRMQLTIKGKSHIVGDIGETRAENGRI